MYYYQVMIIFVNRIATTTEIFSVYFKDKLTGGLERKIEKAVMEPPFMSSTGTVTSV